MEENFIGAYMWSPDNIGTVDGLTSKVFYDVALHEFGHARGLGHIEAPDAIMHPGIGANTAPHLTDSDLLECLRNHACSLE